VSTKRVAAAFRLSGLVPSSKLRAARHESRRLLQRTRGDTALGREGQPAEDPELKGELAIGAEVTAHVAPYIR
jgi:hypothetical protein